MTDNAAGMTVRAGCYFKFGMSIPLAKVPFLRHFGGDRGAPGTEAPGIEAAAGVGDRSDGRGEGNAGGGGRRRRKSQLGPKLSAAGTESRLLLGLKVYAKSLQALYRQ